MVEGYQMQWFYGHRKKSTDYEDILTSTLEAVNIGEESS